MKTDNANKPLISVIIPAYNAEEYIENCIRSVTAQTWRNLEILVVNDGSTDATARIVSKAAKLDGRIHPIHLENNGQIFHARLKGMKASRGDYLLSVDADDQISEDYLEQLLEASQAADADLAICDHMIGRDPDGKIHPILHKIPADREYHIPLENIEYEYYRFNGENKIIDRSYVVFMSKLYRRDLVERSLPWFDRVKLPITYVEDVLYAGIFLRLAKRTVFTHQGTYYYTDNPLSVTHANLVDRLGKITRDQLETLYFLDFFLKQTEADAQLMKLYKNWKSELWGFLELRYAMYRSLIW